MSWKAAVAAKAISISILSPASTTFSSVQVMRRGAMYRQQQLREAVHIRRDSVVVSPLLAARLLDSIGSSVPRAAAAGSRKSHCTLA